jgi:hypothetical protein
METGTAPRWIRKMEKRCHRARWMWVCVSVLGWLGWLGSMLSRQMPDTAWGNVLRVACLAAFVALLVLAPGKRARRCEMAARTLNTAIVRYEASPARPESVLAEAGQRAREILRLERIRTAPAWIGDQRRSYRLRILGWISPALLALAFAAAAVVLRWQWVQPWHGAVLLAVFILYSVGSLFGTRKLMKARDILGQAMERYEYESAAVESDLDEAGQRASEVAPPRSGRRQPAA